MGKIQIKGAERLMGVWATKETVIRSKILVLRVDMARELTTSLMKNIPVWSGRTINSIAWGSMASQNIQPHPYRGGYAIEGKWKYDDAFKATNSMGAKPPTGEPMRAGAEAHALAQVESLYGYSGRLAFLTINSVPWELIEVGRAPGGKGQKVRNTAVVSKIALQQVRAKFGKNIR